MGMKPIEVRPLTTEELIQLDELYRGTKDVRVRSRAQMILLGAEEKMTAPQIAQELEAASIRISMDGRGRVFDNIFVERLWRTVKYEDIYIKEYATVPALFTGLSDYFNLYNYERPH